MSTAAIHTGVIVAFDEHIGLGVVSDDKGDQVGFHCTQLSNDSRTIAPGTAVHFVLVPRHKGTYEAYAVTPVVAG